MWPIKINHMIIENITLKIVICFWETKDMLKGISAQELANKSLVQDTDIEKIQNKSKNPYAEIDKTLLIDESNISNEAIKLYQRDLEIKKFTGLAMSDPENTDYNNLVIEKVFQADDEQFNSKIIDGIIENKSFIKDLLG